MQVDFNYYDNTDLNRIVLKVSLCLFNQNYRIYASSTWITQLNLPDCVKISKKKKDKWTTKEGQKMIEK